MCNQQQDGQFLLGNFHSLSRSLVLHPNPPSSRKASPQTCTGLLPGSEQMMRKFVIQVPGTDPPCTPAPASPHLICSGTTLSLARTEILECPGHVFMGETLLTSTSQLSFHRLDLLERKRKGKKKNPIMTPQCSGCFISRGGCMRPRNCRKIYETGITLGCCWLMYLWCGCCESTL